MTMGDPRKKQKGGENAGVATRHWSLLQDTDEGRNKSKRTQEEKQKPHRGPVSEYIRQVHRLMLPMIVLKMGFRTHRTSIVSLTRIKLKQIIQVDCCFYGTVWCVFYNII